MNEYYRNKAGAVVSTELKKEWDLMKEFVENDEFGRLVKEIKEMATYKKILEDSFGGIMFNSANKDKYDKDINAKFQELKKINSDIWNTTDGIFRGIYAFIMEEQ